MPEYSNFACCSWIPNYCSALNKIIYIQGFLITLLQVSCYELPEIPLKQFDASELDKPSVEFMSIEDVLYTWGNFRIDFTISSEQPVYSYEIYLDNELLEEADGSTPSDFILETTKYPDGFYILKLVIFTKSGSGSIADQFDLEMQETSFIKEIQIDNSTEIETPEITGFDIINGELNIFFKVFEGKGFEKWQLKRTFPNALIATSTNQQITSIEIPNYMGEDAEYVLELYAKGQKKIQKYSYTHDFGFVFTEMPETNDLKISWNPVELKNFSHFSFNSLTENFGTAVNEITIDGSKLERISPYNHRIIIWFSPVIGSIYPLKQSYSIRDNLVKMPVDDVFYTFRTPDILTAFQNFECCSETLGPYTVTNYRIKKKPSETYDSLYVLNSATNVVFSENYKLIYKFEGNQIQQLDTMSLAPIAQYDLSHLVQSNEVAMVYVGPPGKIGIRHASELKILMINLDALQIEEVLDLSCDRNELISFDFNETHLLLAKQDALFGRVSPYYLKSTSGIAFCGSSSRQYFWFEKGYNVTYANGVDVQFRKDEGFNTVFETHTIAPYTIAPKITGNTLFSLGNDFLYRAYDLETFNLVYQSGYSNQYNMLERARRPQLKNGRMSFMSNSDLYFWDVK